MEPIPNRSPFLGLQGRVHNRCGSECRGHSESNNKWLYLRYTLRRSNPKCRKRQNWPAFWYLL